MNVNTLVLTGFGINCENETAHVFELAGSNVRKVHLNDLAQDPAPLHESHILAIPGGFSFGDDVASGRILANRLRYALGEPLKQFVSDGKLAIGICNGFQVMVKMGILPLTTGDFIQEVTLTHNDSSRFEDRWVNLKVDEHSLCVWTQGIETLEVPIRHGEGKFLVRDAALRKQLQDAGQIVVRYALPDGVPAHNVYPHNPNGSENDIAGICDPTGRIFGLMPHPEAFWHRTNHPRWTREYLPEEGAGMAVFRNAVDFARANLG